MRSNPVSKPLSVWEQDQFAAYEEAGDFGTEDEPAPDIAYRSIGFWLTVDHMVRGTRRAGFTGSLIRVSRACTAELAQAYAAENPNCRATQATSTVIA